MCSRIGDDLNTCKCVYYCVDSLLISGWAITLPIVLVIAVFHIAFGAFTVQVVSGALLVVWVVVPAFASLCGSFLGRPPCIKLLPRIRVRSDNSS